MSFIFQVLLGFLESSPAEAQMGQPLFEDGSWALFRASGTEPVVRIYLESGPKEKLSKLKSRVLDFVQSLLKD